LDPEGMDTRVAGRCLGRMCPCRGKYRAWRPPDRIGSTCKISCLRPSRLERAFACRPRRLYALRWHSGEIRRPEVTQERPATPAEIQSQHQPGNPPGEERFEAAIIV